MGRSLAWLKLGWRDLKACPLASLLYGFCFLAGGGLSHTWTLRGQPAPRTRVNLRIFASLKAMKNNTANRALFD
jgi:hypothetical protein